MTHLISTYAGALGLRIDRPNLLSTFTPLPFTRYVTIQTGSGQAAKNYDYWQEVLVLAGPHLTAAGISVVHLGAKDDPALGGVHDLRGKTSIAQSHYLIQGALLHMGNDSWLAHCAGWNRRPLVAVYGNTSAQNHGPYWSDEAKTRLLSSHRAGGVPIYASQENPKTVNWIAPETVGNAVLELLGLPQRLTHETRLIGLLYNHVLFDVVPNSFPGPDLMPEAPMTVRMDLHHDERVLANLLATGRKVNVLTKRPIDLALLHQFRNSILSYTHEIDEECPLLYAGALGSVIKHHSFCTKEKDPAKVAALRYQFFDVCTIQPWPVVTREDYLDSALTYLNRKGDDARRALEGELAAGTVRFKSNRFILSDGKVYLSQAHLARGVATPDIGKNEAQAIDDPQFWCDANNTILYHQP